MEPLKESKAGITSPSDRAEKYVARRRDGLDRYKKTLDHKSARLDAHKGLVKPLYPVHLRQGCNIATRISTTIPNSRIAVFLIMIMSMRLISASSLAPQFL